MGVSSDVSSAKSFEIAPARREVTFPRECADRGGKAVFWDQVYYGNNNPNPRYHCITEDQAGLSGSGITGTGSFRACSVYVKPGYKLVAFTRSDYGSGRTRNSGNPFDQNSNTHLFHEDTSIGDLTQGGNPFEVRSYLLVPSVAIEQVEETTGRVTLTYSRGLERSTTSWSRGGAAFRKTDDAIEISRDSDPERWEELMTLDELMGLTGEQGEQGAQGEQWQKPILSINPERTHVVYRYADDEPWQNLIALSDLKGDRGPAGYSYNVGTGVIVQDTIADEVACDYTRRGTTRFNTASGVLEFCDSYEWRSQAAGTSAAGYIGDVAELGSANSTGGRRQCVITDSGSLRCWERDGSQWPAIVGPVREIAAGEFHTCALDGNDEVRCWGRNNYHQISGIPSDLRSGGAGTAKQISAGWFHTCALDGNDEVRCWGPNSSRAVSGIPSDLRPGGTGTAKQISAGGQHTCALDGNGHVRCWGVGMDRNRVEDRAQNKDHDQAVPPPTVAEPVRQIATGNNHACLVEENRHVACWGNNTYGQLAPSTPVGQVRQVVVGDWHTCVLKVDNRVDCRGLGSESGDEDGDENRDHDQATPPDTEMRQIAAGALHTCGIDFSNRVHCWGNPGDDRASGHQTLNLDPVRQITAGGSHTCALTVENDVHCWGKDNFGQHEPDNPEKMRQIAAGLHFTCGIKMNGAVDCWGAGEAPPGNPPVGPHFGQSIPPGELASGTTPAKRITAGRYHACALTMDDEVKCWGDIITPGSLGTIKGF